MILYTICTKTKTSFLDEYSLSTTAAAHEEEIHPQIGPVGMLQPTTIHSSTPQNILYSYQIKIPIRLKPPSLL